MTSRSQKQRKALPIPQMRRKHVVWVSLLASMTTVGGLLLVLDRGPRASADTVPLVEVARQSPTKSFDQIFQVQSEIQPGRWTGIVVHHSASPVGSAETLTRQHNERGYKGLGYHFVISNGQGAPDGQIVVGYRWQQQLPGVHVIGPKAEQYNMNTIGICLIGDGDRREFTDAQMTHLLELISALQDRLAIPDHAVVLHRDIAPTASPGRNFPEVALRQGLTDTP